MSPQECLFLTKLRRQMKIKRTEFNRSQIKSSEGEFIYEMENSYELSPKLSQQILLTAKECLVKEYNLREGQIEITVVSIEERAGYREWIKKTVKGYSKPLAAMTGDLS
jgi:hypothetical protein